MIEKQCYVERLISKNLLQRKDELSGKPPSGREGDRVYAVEGVRGTNDHIVRWCCNVLSFSRGQAAPAPSRREPLKIDVHLYGLCF